MLTEQQLASVKANIEANRASPWGETLKTLLAAHNKNKRLREAVVLIRDHPAATDTIRERCVAALRPDAKETNDEAS